MPVCAVSDIGDKQLFISSVTDLFPHLCDKYLATDFTATSSNHLQPVGKILFSSGD